MKVRIIALAVSSAFAFAQQGSVITPDPGITTTRLLVRPEIRVSRLEIQPGAVRRVHQHDDVKYHLFVPLTGTVQVTVGSAKPEEGALGKVFFMEKGTPHGFKNTGTSMATALEVFVNDTPARAGVPLDEAAALALAQAFTSPPSTAAH